MSERHWITFQSWPGLSAQKLHQDQRTRDTRRRRRRRRQVEVHLHDQDQLFIYFHESTNVKIS